MTDKQIIIDGVDVSGCECYTQNIKMDCILHPLQSDACKNNPNCYYKQLKRKEQKHEELKEEIKHYKQIAQYHGNLSVKYTNKSAKLRQTLAEIKEIAEKSYRTPLTEKDCIKCDEILAQILQKISEVENDNA